MMSEICLVLSCVAVAVSLITSLIQRFMQKRNRFFSSHTCLIIGAAAASFFWFFGVYFEADPYSFISSILSTVKIFGADGVNKVLKETSAEVGPFYLLWGQILSLWAPVLTFTVILSFFKTAVARLRYSVPLKTHVFSELNDRSLALAKMLRKGKGGRFSIIAFANIVDQKEEKYLALIDEARKINAILFRNDLESIKWAGSRLMFRNLSFYLISDDGGEKVRHAKGIVDRYNNSKCSLFIFDNGEESKRLLHSYCDNIEKKPIHIKIARIDDTRLLTYGYLFDNGKGLFRNAPRKKGLEEINVTIVGFGDYGIEMFKALFWYCQMPGYRVNFTIIDKDERAQARFEAMFPSLEVGKSFEESNSVRYRVDFKRSTFGEGEFIKDVQGLKEDNFFFVFLGDDQKNMMAIDAIRRAREQAGKPYYKASDNSGDRITTVIYNADIRKLVSDDKDISLINSVDRFFLFERFGANSFIEDGLDEHILGLGDKAEKMSPEDIRNDYYLNDYNFYSSLSHALHRKLRDSIKDLYYEPYKTVLNKTKSISDARAYKTQIEKALNNESTKMDATNNLYVFAKIEHVRWNAYMFTEGFVYNEKKYKAFKMHDKLVDVNKLKTEDCLQDI